MIFMIELYYWPTPNGHKISIALEEMGLLYEIKSVNIGAGDQFKPEFLAFSPNNRIPAIIDHDGPDGKPVTIFESGAILLYLADKTGQLMPTAQNERIAVYEWLMWQMGGLGPMLGQVHYFSRYNSGKSVYAEERFKNEALRLYRVLEGLLSDREFLSHSYSIADMAVWPWISRFEWQGIDLNELPNILRWYVEISERPAVVRGYDQPFFVNKIPMP